MFTNNLTKIVDKRKKRVGRGPGSGKGSHTVGKGQKGQTSRGGNHKRRDLGSAEYNVLLTYPKLRGNKSLNKGTTAVRISKLIEKNIFEIDVDSLRKISDARDLKLVGDTTTENVDWSKVTVKSGVKITNSLKETILANGGKVEE